MKYLITKLFWFFAYPIKRFYWFICRPKTKGVKCIVEKDGKFLLVKINYAHYKWTFPGGKVERRESSLDAAVRETKEETGINVINPVYRGFYTSTREYKKDTVEVYFGTSDTFETKINPTEIKEAKWFERSNFPENKSPVFDQILKTYDEYGSIKN